VYAYGDFAFHHIPKTGGSSVKRMLLTTELPFKNIGDSEKPKVHTPLSEQKEYLEKYEYIYTNIRNPFERIVSLYTFNTLRRKFGVPEASFGDFFHNHWYLNPDKSEWLLSTEEYLLVDGSIPKKVILFRLEDIDYIWPKIIKFHFGKEVLEIPRENTTLHGDSMEYFDTEMIKKVNEKEGWVLSFYNTF